MGDMRKLATIRKIDAIDPIPNADSIECVTIGGWKVVAQKGLYQVNDLACYLEVDSWVPTTIAPFLTKSGHYPKVFEGVEGERLKTIKLRGQVSQGLLLPGKQAEIDGVRGVYYTIDAGHGSIAIPWFKEGDDVTEALGILKWEKPLPAQLQGRVRGNFPFFIPKTDQERVQNIKREYTNEVESGSFFEVTEKIDGSSMTVFVFANADDPGNVVDRFGVCSRNLELIETEGNAYWDTARKLDLEGKIRQVLASGMIEGCTSLAIQGELCGPGIQGNIYKLDEVSFVVFDIFDITAQKYLIPEERRAVCNRFGFYHVPVIYAVTNLSQWPTVETLLEYADGPSLYNRNAAREGLVFKHCDRNFSFKAISNKFLLKHGD